MTSIKGLRISVTLAILGMIMTLLIVLKQHAPYPEDTMMVSPPPSNVYIDAIAGSGIVESLEENVQVGIHIPGIVKTIFAKAGDKVKKGEPLLLIDEDFLQNDIQAEQLEMKAKALEVKKIREQLKRIESVANPKAICLDDLKNKTLDCNIAQMDLKAKKRRIKAKKVQLEKHLLNAPKDGIVSRFTPRVGEYVSNQSQESAIVIGSKQLQIRADIDEENAERIQKDHPAVAYTRGLSKTPIELEFLRIEPYVIPKTALTGRSNERVDTRVLQVIYSVKESEKLPIYIGQQVDIYIQDK